MADADVLMLRDARAEDMLREDGEIMLMDDSWLRC
jgi:hypothetical protein